MVRRRKEWEDTEVGKKFETRKARQRLLVVWIVVTLAMVIPLWEAFISDFFTAVGILISAFVLSIIISAFIEF